MKIMTQQSKYAAVKSVIGKFIFTSLVLASVTATHAQSISATDSTKQEASVSYLGPQEQMSLFAVNFSNPAEDKYMVSVQDKDGDVLHKELYSGKTFDKVFRLPKDADNTLNFVIKNLKDSSVQVFEIATTTSVIEDVVIKSVE
jgi:hypothetical protein